MIASYPQPFSPGTETHHYPCEHKNRVKIKLFLRLILGILPEVGMYDFVEGNG